MRLWSTDAVPKSERFAFWNDAVCDAFLRVRTERAENASFNGSIASSRLGPLHINRVKSERHLVRRSRRVISADTEGWFFLNFQQQGECVLSQQGRDQHVRQGELCFFDGIRPFDLDFRSDMSLTCFMIPREVLRARVIDAADRVVNAIPRAGVGALLHRFSADLSEAARDLSPAAAVRVGDMYLDLLALALDDTRSIRDASRESLREALYASVRADIRLRLSEPGLDLASVAARAGIAPRTLQTWFHENGTCFTEFVLEQRLELAARQLQDIAPQASISEIAYVTGFSDLSYFSRCFRRRFGVRPRDVREAARRQTIS